MFQGAHYIEAETIIDTDSGKVIDCRPGTARELPRDKVTEFLGERFVEFEAQLRSAMNASAEAKQKASEAERALAAVNEKQAS